jgi:Domain of unknown function (DUF1905)/Bacteriocin-protection, YdeI or OmpD-Associated
MVKFSATIQKFGQQGEKTGWTYIAVPQDISEKLMPGNRKSFRVKGRLDEYEFTGIALIPMGGGSFIMALNAAIRRDIKKKQGAMLKVELTVDHQPIEVPEDLALCLADEPRAQEFFSKKLPMSHRNYFIKWIAGVKSDAARAKRIARAVNALAREMNFAEMLRWEKNNPVF